MRNPRSLTVTLLLITVVLTSCQSPAAPPSSTTVTRVSVASDGAESSNRKDLSEAIEAIWLGQEDGSPSPSVNPSLSADGRFVAFESDASNLVPDDMNRFRDIFVHDRQTGQITRVSVTNRAQGNSESENASLSADGRFVAFESKANSFFADDTTSTNDVYVHDRQTGQLTRVSVAADGAEGNGDSYDPRLSADGRFVAFSSEASNLVPGDTNGHWDIFVHDRETGQTTRVSVSSDGAEGNEESWWPSLSVDGRFVVFRSSASNLVAGDTNDFCQSDNDAEFESCADIFVHDRETGQTTRVSVSSDGAESNTESWYPSLSADGRFVAFGSSASNLVASDTNDFCHVDNDAELENCADVFVHDRQTGQTTRVSVSSDGTESNSSSGGPRLSADGRFVAFGSSASNLVPDDTNGVSDIFVHDRETGQTTRVSVASVGTQGNRDSYSPSISADGRLVAFASSASNLVAGDTNETADVFVVALPAAP